MERLKNTLSRERKINRFVEILFKTIYRRKSASWRAEYIRKKNIFHMMGENCYYQPTKLPSDACLVSIHNNVVISTNVSFVTHDIFARSINANPRYKEKVNLPVHFEPIEILDDVIIGGGYS